MDDTCTIYKTADFVGKRWTILILLELHKGKNELKRYNELKKTLPKITSKILSLRLKELEKQKLIVKKINAKQFPITCEYSLTESGKDFIKIIQDMKKWALKHKFDNKVCESSACKHCEF